MNTHTIIHTHTTQVPGALLLRDPSGNVFAVQTETVQQIDLSDDLVCLLMFADGAWEGQMAPIEFAGDDGKVKQLKLNDKVGAPRKACSYVVAYRVLSCVVAYCVLSYAVCCRIPCVSYRFAYRVCVVAYRVCAPPRTI
jgi:hypothetical protein